MIPTLSTLFGPNASVPVLAGGARNFEVPEPRLARLLGTNAGIVRIPTNAELDLEETR